MQVYVSIPFKRESPFGLTYSQAVDDTNWVSIPFKRESPFGHQRRHDTLELGRLFQFPSNGKVLSDEQLPSYRSRPLDEFQFPSNGKVLSDFTLGFHGKT